MTTDTNNFTGYRKIKHWQGYGSVGVQKAASQKFTQYGQKKTRIVIKVKGWNEWGIEVDSFDTYRIYNWLLSRYDKSLKDFMDFDNRNPEIEVTTNKEDGVPICYYDITYNAN